MSSFSLFLNMTIHAVCGSMISVGNLARFSYWKGNVCVFIENIVNYFPRGTTITRDLIFFIDCYQ